MVKNNKRKKDLNLHNSITNKIKENSHLFWNSYQHMYDVRKRNIQNKIDFLLIVATFLPVLSIMLYNTELFSNEIILVPVIFQIIALFILLSSFFVKTSLIHWFKFEKTLDLLIEDKFHKDFFCDLKALESGTYDEMNVTYKKIIRPALNLIIFSLYSVLISVIFIIFQIGIMAYVILLSLSFLFMVFLNYCYKPASFNTDEAHEKLIKEFDQWLKEKQSKK